jgi:hypothetical protein
MKNHILLLITITFLSIAKAQHSRDNELLLTKSLSNESIQKVYARTSGGSIAVSGVGNSESRLEVYVLPNGKRDKETTSKEEIQKRLKEDYDLIISVTDNQLSVTAKPKSKITNWKQHLNISFKIFINPAVSTDLHTSGGSISLSKLSGDQVFSTSGGSLNLNELDGKIVGKTSGGSINLKNSKNDINLKTSGGSINADNCDGKIRLSTSGGSLNFKDLNGTIEAHTSGGSINGSNIQGELNTHTSGGSVNLRGMACSLEASTSGGSVNVSVVKFGRYLKLSNSGSGINLELPDKQGLDLDLRAEKISIDALNNFSGKKEDDEISGTLNGGGIPVTVKAGSGRIRLTFR